MNDILNVDFLFVLQYPYKCKEYSFLSEHLL
jgi:hypothetical protein